MQMDKAELLRERWARRQKKDTKCRHANLSREYCLGAHTGDEVCLRCGKTFSPADLPPTACSKQSPKTRRVSDGKRIKNVAPAVIKLGRRN